MTNHRALKLPTRFGKKAPGTSPGILPDQLEKLPPATPSRAAKVTVIDYSPDQVEMRGVLDFDAFLAVHRPAWSAVRWINIDGLTDLIAIESLAKKYELHPWPSRIFSTRPPAPRSTPTAAIPTWPRDCSSSRA